MEFKTFSEAYNTGKPFYQLCYYDRRETYSGDRICRNFSSKEDAEKVIRELEKESEKLFQAMLEFYKDYGVTEENYRDNNLWNFMKVDYSKLSKVEKRFFRYDKNAIGYCYIELNERDKEREEREEKDRKEIEEPGENCEADEGPYGGAFDSYEELYRWIEGPGFFSD